MEKNISQKYQEVRKRIKELKSLSYDTTELTEALEASLKSQSNKAIDLINVKVWRRIAFLLWDVNEWNTQ